MRSESLSCELFYLQNEAIVVIKDHTLDGQTVLLHVDAVLQAFSDFDTGPVISHNTR